MAIGSRALWTDHEKKVCFRDSATISSLVIVPGAVVVPMGSPRGGAVSSGSVSMGGHYRSAEATPDLPDVVGDEQHSESEQPDEQELAQEGHGEDQCRDEGEDDRDPEDELDDVLVEERLDGEVGREQGDERERRGQ